MKTKLNMKNLARMWGLPKRRRLPCGHFLFSEQSLVLRSDCSKLLFFIAVSATFTLGCTGNTENPSVSRASRIDLVSWMLSIREEFPEPTIRNNIGKPLYSWRPSVLPEFSTRKWQKNNPDANWTTPCFKPFRSNNHEIFTNGKTPKSEVFLVTGKGTAFPSEGTIERRLIPGSTLIAVESFSLDKHWLQPGDVDISSFEKMLLEDTTHDSIWVVFADGLTAEIPRTDSSISQLKDLTNLVTSSEAIRNELLKSNKSRQENQDNSFPDPENIK